MENEIPLDGPVPGESLTSGIKQLPYDRPPEMTDNSEIQERLWKSLSKPSRIRQINALLEVGVPVDELSAQIAHGMFREGQIAPQNAVMILPSLVIMIARIGEAMGTKGMRIATGDKHGGISNEEIRAVVEKSKGAGSSNQKTDMNNKTAKGFKAVADSSPELVKKADNVGFLKAAKEKI